MKNYVDKDKLQEYTTKLNTKLKTIFATKAEVGSPLVASTVAEMTDESRIYVYTGSESGYTAGNWYYYNGSAWTSGGVYNSTAFETDATLAVPGMAADAKAAGDAIGEVEGDVTNLKTQLNGTDGLLFMTVPRIIGSDGVWTQVNAGHISIPINAGDIINITAGDRSFAYAFLVSDNSSSGSVAADLSQQAGYTSRFVLAANENSGNVNTPSDAAFLYINTRDNRGDYVTPASVKINGVERWYNIRKKIDEISAKADNNTAGIDELAEKEGTLAYAITYKATRKNVDIWGMRKEYHRSYSRIDFSALTFLNNFDINAFTDGFDCFTDFDLRNYKNSGGSEITVHNSAELASALTAANSGDTIKLAKGIYSPIVITKSINLIADELAMFSAVNLGTITQTATAGTYSTEANFTESYYTILDTTKISEGIIIPLRRGSSISNVSAIPGSYRVSSNKIYIHMLDGSAPTPETCVIIGGTTPIIDISQPAENAIVYMENIYVFGGTRNLIYANMPDYLTQKLMCYNCKFWYATQYNAVNLFGVNGYFQKCECAFAYRDGFNYHANKSSEYSGPNTDTVSNGLEIDCIGHDNGLTDTSTNHSDNGSSNHNGGKSVRIGGVYYRNQGGNVADIGASTESYNYSCWAFDSVAPVDTNNADFWSSTNAVVNLYGCRAVGDSQYNLMSDGVGVINVSNTEYTTKTGNVVDA